MYHQSNETVIRSTNKREDETLTFAGVHQEQFFVFVFKQEQGKQSVHGIKENVA